MKFLYFVLFIFIIYVSLILFIILRNNLSYKDIDLNSNWIISFSELMYSLDVKKEYICYTNERDFLIKNKIDNYEKYKKIIMRIYSVKDGLTIKKIVIKL